MYQSNEGGKTYVPLEADARVLETATPGLAKAATWKYAMMGGEKVAEDFRENERRPLSKALVQKISERLGDVMRERETEWEYDLPVLAEEVTVVGIGRDGTCTALVGDGWRQAMVGTLSLYGKSGERLHTIYMGCAPEPGKETFDYLLDRELSLLKSKLPSANYSGIADGAHDNWKFFETRTNVDVLDYFHATEYLSTYSGQAISRKVERKAWFDQARLTLRDEDGGAQKLLDEMKRGYAVAKNATRKEKIEDCITYFSNNQNRMDYPEYKRRGIPIGSGVTEAACKTLVKARLGGSGMKWTPYGIDNILMTRGLILTQERWNQFWQKVSKYGYK